LCLGWLLLAGACTPEPLASVDPPPDLAQLDQAVREQFEELWSEGQGAGPVAPEVRRNWGALAQWFHVYRYHASAATCYEHAMRVAPDEPRWPYLRGLLATEHGDMAQARPLFLRALALAPDAPHVHVRLADLARSEGELDSAERGYRAALALDPADSAARFGLAQLALEGGDAEAALEWLVPLSAEQPEAAELNYALGTAWRLAGDNARAEAALGEVPETNLHQVALRREDPWLAELMRTDQGARQLTRRAVQAAQRGENDRAAVLFGAAVQRDPDGAEERLNWALALARLGHHEQARSQIEQAIARAEPGSELEARIQLESGRLHAQAGRPRQGEAQLRSLLARRPDQSRARVELSRLLHTRGELEGALEQYQALRETDAFSAELAFWQAAAGLALDQRDAASRQLQLDIAAFPKASRLQTLHWRVTATQQPPDLQALREAMAQLTGLEQPLDVLQAETLAMTYAALQAYPTAIAWQEAVVHALAGESRSAPLRIVRRRLALYREGKRPEKAWETTERPLELPVRSPYPASPAAP
jgi:Tfp pilus assembly protein PilF